jgi:zinc transport system ATP-binding protein
MIASDSCHEPVIELDRLTFGYAGERVFHELSATIRQRDFVGVIGANGAGKTTLLKLIVGLLKPDSGEVRLFGTPIGRFGAWERIGYVPQRNAINPQFPASVREVVLSGLYTRGKRWRRLGKEELKRADEAMRALGIEHLADKRIGRLSGGQQQRVFLARAIIHNPELLILDEPFTGVDEETQRSFFHILKHMHQHHNMTFLMVSHDLQMMRDYLGNAPERLNNRISLYVRHSHGSDCSGTDIMHSLREQLLVTAGENG